MKAKGSRILCLLLIAVLFFSAARSVNAVSTLTPASTISSVPVPATMAYDPGKGEIFAQYGFINGGAGVSVISDSTNKVVANVTETTTPNGYIGEVAYDSAKGEIFAASGGGGINGGPPVITVISDSNNSLIATISWNTGTNSQYDWPTEPYGVVYDSGKGEIFVSDLGALSGNVYILSDTTNSVVATISLSPVGQTIPAGQNPGEMVYDPAAGEVFVADTGSNYVSVISDSTNKVVANVNVPAATPSSLAYDPNKGEVFVYCRTTIYVISDRTNNVTATISGLNLSQGSSTIAYDSAKGEIFAGAVISDSTNTVVAQLPAGIGNIIYDPGKGEIFATTSTGIDLFSDSSSVSTSTTTSAPATFTSATSTTVPHTTSTASSSSSSSIPEFPYQLSAAAVLAAVLVASYLFVRSRTISGDHPATAR